MTITVMLPGGEIVPSTPLEPGLAPYLEATVIRAHVVQGQARGAAPEGYIPFEAHNHDIVELEWHNGVTQWLSVEQLRDDVRLNGAERGASAGIVRVPLYAPYGRASRGAPDWLLKGLKILRISPAVALADASAQAIMAHYEGKLQPGPGLYRLVDPETLGSRVEHPSELAGDEPWLVLLHGTFSWTTASFGALAGTSEWRTLRQRYGDRMLAFDHRTLSESPIQNALELARVLPQGATLHLVSHSRGGLVGELLCLRPLTDADLRLFHARERQADIEALLELSRLLHEKQFDIARFVRVACPARGTLLASKRLDMYLSILVNVIGHLPLLSTSPLYAFAKATLLELVSRRTDPEHVPGLEAQMPESPLIHLLNRPGVAAKADLAVIAGDIEAAGFWGHLKAFATDLFYREDHDLVVNTAAMYGGMGREAGAYYFFDSGAAVHHFNYFANSGTRQRLLSWLTREHNHQPDPTFKQIVRGVQRSLHVSTPRSRQDGAVVVLVPDLLGSHLRGPSGRIWLDYETLMRDGLEGLDALDDTIVPDGVLATPYQRLTDQLAAHYRVQPFAYDWRRSLVDAGAHLAQLVHTELGQHSLPVSFVAHGMGSLVVRAMIAGDREVWQQVSQRGGRVVMLGTAHAPSTAALAILQGRATIVRLLELTSPRQTRREIVHMFRSFPGLLELLPLGRSGEHFTQEWWKRADGRPPTVQKLKHARRVRETLETTLDSARMSYIAGGPTPRNGSESAEERGANDLTGSEGVPTWYVEKVHGELPTSDVALDAVLEILARGRTQRLTTTAPTGVPLVPDQIERPLLFPTEEELAAAALGRTITAQSGETRWSVRVSVTHGHLRKASYPLAIGHYQGDTLVSAEAVLNAQLGGRLAQRLQMNLYPGPVDSVEVVDAPGCFPPGALVIGLGEVGSITPERLQRGVTEAALRYALTVRDRGGAPSGGWRSAAFSTVLIGTQGGSGLSLQQSLQAIVAGALLANRMLRAQEGLWQHVRIDAVECIELYEDLAIEVVRALQVLEKRPPIALEADEYLEIDDVLRVAEGGLFQRPANPYSTGWWRRIQISEERKHESAPGCDLRFVALTDRARAEETLRYTQRALIDGFIKEAIRSPTYDRELVATLFELLLPNAIKDQARDEGDVVLVVDAAAAQYPWELLAERIGDNVYPVVTQRGMIRQFTTARYRQNPRCSRGSLALVVGDTKSSLPELPGAQHEAQAVVRRLEAAQFQVRPLLQEAPAVVLKQLFAHDYRILHLAGHGIYQPGNAIQSGMVLEDGIYLTSAELGQLRVVPELVFINCCHLGSIDRTDGQANKLAASIAQELIEMGVRAVVAAGWAVDDDAAATFATTFYDALLGGDTFGQAVFAARCETNRQFPHSTTWGAYQCYGNPDWTVGQTTSGSYATRQLSPRFVGRSETLDYLRSVEAEAREATTDRKRELRRQADEWLPDIRQEWRDGELLSFLGRFWAALGDFERAITYYQEAIDTEDARAPVWAIEQLANLEGRHAEKLSDTTAAIQRSTERLQWLLTLGRTAERLSLLGSNYKRRARMAKGDERLQWLCQARDCYGEVHQTKLKQQDFDTYSALNWVTLCAILGDEPPTALLSTIAGSEQIAAERERRVSTFYQRIALADAALLRHLVQHALVGNAESVAEHYHRALASGVSGQELALVSDQLEFLIAMLEAADGNTAQALRSIRDAVVNNISVKNE